MTAFLNDINTWTLRTANNFRQFIDTDGHTWVEQNISKQNGWVAAVKAGHKIAWEFLKGSYTGRVLLDGEVMLKGQAIQKLWGADGIQSTMPKKGPEDTWV